MSAFEELLEFDEQFASLDTVEKQFRQDVAEATKDDGLVDAAHAQSTADAELQDPKSEIIKKWPTLFIDEAATYGYETAKKGRRWLAYRRSYIAALGKAIVQDEITESDVNLEDLRRQHELMQGEFQRGNNFYAGLFARTETKRQAAPTSALWLRLPLAQENQIALKGLLNVFDGHLNESGHWSDLLPDRQIANVRRPGLEAQIIHSIEEDGQMYQLKMGSNLLFNIVAAQQELPDLTTFSEARNGRVAVVTQPVRGQETLADLPAEVIARIATTLNDSEEFRFVRTTPRV